MILLVRGDEGKIFLLYSNLRRIYVVVEVRQMIRKAVRIVVREIIRAENVPYGNNGQK